MLATVKLDGAPPAAFRELRYPIPVELLAATPADGTLRITFTAAPDSLAGGIYEVRLGRLRK
jgi:oxalate decarboxylase/phosphoglucose isomerase-like protein (cupin superfamily)